MKPPEAYAVPALDKGLDILELLATHGGGHTQKQIADAIGRGPSEIFRMLLGLQRRGYIRRTDPGDTYRLTAKLFDLAHRHPPTEELLRAAIPVMQKVAVQTRQSCHLAVAEGENALTLARADSPEPRGFSVRIGASFPLADTASGLVLLAFGGEAGGRRRPKVLAARLSRIRRCGFERARSRSVLGVIDLSYPVLNHRGAAIAAITVPFLTLRGQRNDVDAVQRILAVAAAELSASVGGREAPFRQEDHP